MWWNDLASHRLGFLTSGVRLWSQGFYAILGSAFFVGLSGEDIRVLQCRNLLPDHGHALADIFDK